MGLMDIYHLLGLSTLLIIFRKHPHGVVLNSPPAYYKLLHL